MGDYTVADGAAQARVRELGEARRKRQRAALLLLALAALVAVGVFWQLHYTGVALSNEALCGIEEHQHSEACYDADGSLACGLEEHAHTAECYADGAAEAAAAQTYEAEGEGYSVTVTAPAGALPEGAVLTVELLDEDGDEYAEAAEAVGYDASDGDAGMAALDISFAVDGEEVEPSGAVAVSIDASALLPGGADASTLEVRHLAETGAGVQPELVADAAGASAGTVDAETAVAEFEVGGFSTFTITWSGNGNWGQTTTYFTITVHHVDESGNELVADTSNVTLSDNGNSVSQEYKFSSYQASIIGYTYSKAAYSAYNGSEVTTATFSATQSGWNTTRTLTLADADGTPVYSETYSNRTVSVDVYLVYTKAATASVVAKDTTGATLGTTTTNLAKDTNVTLSDLASSAYSDDSYSYSYANVTYTTDDSSEIAIIEDAASIIYNSDGTYTVGERMIPAGAAVTIELVYKTVPTVTISTTKTDDGYLLTATPSNFTNEEDIDYTWAVSSNGATITDNGNGTANLTWANGENAWVYNSETGVVTATVSVTASSTYTTDDGEEVGETANDSLTVSSGLYTVYVFVSGFVQGSNPKEYFSDDMLTLLNVSTLDSYGYFAAGIIYLDMSRFTGDSESMIASDEEWDYVVSVIKESLDESYSQTCSDNLIQQYAEQIIRDIGVKQNNGYSGLWLAGGHSNINDAGGEVGDRCWHLDIRFQTVKITYIYGNNNLESDSQEAGSEVFIKGAVMDYKPGIEVPDGYKFAGYYEDADFTTPWTGYGDPLNEDEEVYIKLVPEDEKVLYYKVAEGEGTLSSYSEGVKESVASAVGSIATAADGWEFEGWYYDEACTQKIAGDVNGTELTPSKPTDGWIDGTTYYAKFVPTSYDITLKKVDSTNNSNFLFGASFILSRTETTTDENGNETTETTYYSYNNETVTWKSSSENATTITTGEAGTETLRSLTTGYTYTLVETAAPDGYNLLTDPITFTVSGGEVTEATYGEGSDSTVATVSDDGKTITVANTPGVELPYTGGSGTVPYALAGLALCIGAGALLVNRRKVRA